MCSIDAEPADFCRSSKLVARVEHKCAECFRVIFPREIYRRTFGVWDGHPDTFKTCAHCLALQSWLLRECNSFLYGGLSEEIDDHAREYQSVWLWRGRIGMRRKWRKRDGSLMQIPDISASPKLGVVA